MCAQAGVSSNGKRGDMAAEDVIDPSAGTGFLERHHIPGLFDDADL